MGFRNIEKNDWFYNFLKHYVVSFTHNKIFYRKVFVLNKEKIPLNDHLIFTPNHQNALMDALVVLCNVDKQLVFLARSDIFQKKVIAFILYFLKILPVYRIRDGYSSVKKNKNTFQKTIDVINAQNGLVILPEGSHEGKRTLRTLKKGFARIAFQTEEASNFSLDSKIIPVGLHYSDYIKARSDLYIIFGDPLPVSNYYGLYKENPAVAINKLTADLAEKIKPLMVNIQDADHYDLFDQLRLIYWEKMPIAIRHAKNKINFRVQAEQEVIQLVEEIQQRNIRDFQALKNLQQSYNNQLQKLKLSNYDLQKPFGSFSIVLNILAFVAGIPFLIYGLAVNLIPVLIVHFIVGKIKDPQFKSSIKYVVSLIVFPTLYLLQSIFFLLIIQSLPFTLFFLFSQAVLGALAYYYISSFKKFKMWLRLWKIKVKYPEKIKTIGETKYAMDQIISNYIDNKIG